MHLLLHPQHSGHASKDTDSSQAPSKGGEFFGNMSASIE